MATGSAWTTTARLRFTSSRELEEDQMLEARMQRNNHRDKTISRCDSIFSPPSSMSQSSCKNVWQPVVVARELSRKELLQLPTAFIVRVARSLPPILLAVQRPSCKGPRALPPSAGKRLLLSPAYESRELLERDLASLFRSSRLSWACAFAPPVPRRSIAGPCPKSPGRPPGAHGPPAVTAPRTGLQKKGLLVAFLNGKDSSEPALAALQLPAPLPCSFAEGKRSGLAYVCTFPQGAAEL